MRLGPPVASGAKMGYSKNRMMKKGASLMTLKEFFTQIPKAALAFSGGQTRPICWPRD